MKASGAGNNHANESRVREEGLYLYIRGNGYCKNGTVVNSFDTTIIIERL